MDVIVFGLRELEKNVGKVLARSSLRQVRRSCSDMRKAGNEALSNTAAMQRSDSRVAD